MKNSTVLLVDDDHLITKFVTLNLQARGYTVIHAADGEQALDIFKHQPVDLVILDIMMPKVNGFEVCQIMRLTSHVPIIMLSGLDSQQDKARCFDMGADDYITKPFSLRILLARVEAVLRRAHDRAAIDPAAKAQ